MENPLVLKFSIPEFLRDRTVDVLQLSRGAENRLLSARIRILGQLHGTTVADIGALRGVGAKYLDEIVSAIRRIQALSSDQAELFELAPRTSQSERVSEGLAIRVTPAVSTWPISVLDISASVRNTLSQQGIERVGQLDELTELDLAQFHYLGPAGRRGIIAAVSDLASPPNPAVLRRKDTGELLPPNAPLSLFRRVERAQDAIQEVDALLQGLPERTVQMLRSRWERRGAQSSTLEAIAAHHGITRERVRQILEKHERLLRTSNLRLPKLAAAVEALDEEGGALPTQLFLRLPASSDCALNTEVLTYVEALGRLGLVPYVAYCRSAKLWLTRKGEEAFQRGSSFAVAFSDVKRSVRRALRRSGCIPIKDLKRTPFGARHAISISLPGGRGFDRIGDYLVPRTTQDSVLVRWVVEMLAVTSELSLEELSAGLRRGTMVYQGRRSPIDVPPAAVLREILSRDDRFVVTESHVRITTLVDRESVLSSTEEVVIGIIEAHGNLATWTQILEAAGQAGCATATTTLALRAPFIAKRGAGIYGLRGRKITPETLRARVRERAATRREAIKRVSYQQGGTRARVVYQLTSFSIAGVLPVPSKMRAISIRSWKARIPGGREFKVTMKSGFIWPLYRWFVKDQLKRGDLIIADFDIPNAIIAFDVAS